MLRAVIFDFDGVITDSEVLHFRAFNKILADFGIIITLKDYYKNYLGLSDFDLFSLLASKGRLRLKELTVEDLIKKKNVIFEKLAKTEGQIIEGVRPFIEMLGKNNIPMAICSGALLVEIEMVLEDADLKRYFRAVVSAEQVSKGKPDPQGFLLALERLNNNSEDKIKPSECVVIEDSHWGIEAAKNAGMHIVAVTNSYDASQFRGGEKFVTRLDELKIEDLQSLCS
ncbi:MAG: HAD family phosphatase [Planctomycetes bacterium]|nr:HAD family phosphatase [Planctomycetota bacterium]MBL7107191.1 HAD family phosphatase [Phycisphaerae bacterium]